MKKPCYTCKHRRCKPDVKSQGHAVAWSCEPKDIRFGYQWQYEAGENMPDRCPQHAELLGVKISAHP